jgi:hypothetical protein
MTSVTPGLKCADGDDVGRGAEQDAGEEHAIADQDDDEDPGGLGEVLADPPGMIHRAALSEVLKAMFDALEAMLSAFNAGGHLYDLRSCPPRRPGSSSSS